MPATPACEGHSERPLQPQVNVAMKLPGIVAHGLTLAIVASTIACTEPATNTAASAPDPRAAAEVGPAQTLPHTLPPPSADHPRFVGLWAASAEGCADPAWRFYADRVATQGEVSCSFRSARQTATGYDIDASCTDTMPPARDYRIQLGFAESARAMMLSGGPWSATGLVYCGPLPIP